MLVQAVPATVPVEQLMAVLYRPFLQQGGMASSDDGEVRWSTLAAIRRAKDEVRNLFQRRDGFNYQLCELQKAFSWIGRQLQ